jgi:hypothetical protein
MQYLQVMADRLSIESGPLSLSYLRHLVGGYFDLPFAYDGLREGESLPFVMNASSRALGMRPTVFVPELLAVVAGPVFVVGFDKEGQLRSMESEELHRFQLVRIYGTAVPRLSYVIP